MKPYLMALNLNGMDAGGDKAAGRSCRWARASIDLDLLRIIRDSGYHGPIGILGHTQDDAEARLHDNLDGLDWLLPQLDGKPPARRRSPRTPVRSPARQRRPSLPARGSQRGGRAWSPRPERRVTPGAEPRCFGPRDSACSSCHKVGAQGGIVGPELTTAGVCLSPEEIAESVLWPRRKIKEGYEAIAVATDRRQGPSRAIHRSRIEREIVLTRSRHRREVRIARATIEEIRPIGTLMPEGIAADDVGPTSAATSSGS